MIQLDTWNALSSVWTVYDFLGLIIGSEGQLGIVTEATVRLLKAPEGARPMLLKRAELCGAEILKLYVKLGGCLTGEHGVGIEKRELMRVQFAAADIAQQMRVKTAFDPDWLLNPAKVFPLEASNQVG